MFDRSKHTGGAEKQENRGILHCQQAANRKVRGKIIADKSYFVGCQTFLHSLNIRRDWMK